MEFIAFDFGTVTVFLILLAISLWVKEYLLKPKVTWAVRPPGPWGWPWLGNLPSMAIWDPRVLLAQYTDKYGDIFSLKLGSETVVVLSSGDVIREAFIKKARYFADRPNLLFIERLTQGKGIISANGHRWKEQRSFTHRVLRDFGMGRCLLEARIQEEVSFYLQELENAGEEEQDISGLTGAAVSNVINGVVFGHRFDYTDPKFRQIISMFKEITETVGNGGVCNFIPVLQYLPWDPFSIKRLLAIRSYGDEIINEKINQHKMSYKRGVVNDLIDAYLDKIHDVTEDDETQEEYFTEEESTLRIVGDLFFAGTETTATTLRWAVLFLMNNPSVQQKVQQEIDQVMDTDRPISMKDLSNLPYTEAMLMEVQRMGDIVPFSVPRCTTEDVELRGFTVPAGTFIWPNLNRVHFNPAVWGDPCNFRPDRFLDEEGKVQRHDDLMPFSVGRRACLGASLARMELFLFLSSVLRRFTFIKPNSPSCDQLDGVLGITWSPKPFLVSLKKRNQTGKETLH